MNLKINVIFISIHLLELGTIHLKDRGLFLKNPGQISYLGVTIKGTIFP